MANDNDDLLLASEVARLAEPPVSATAVRLWANERKLPVLRTASGLRLFRRADVEHFLADRQEQGRAAGRRRR